MLALFQDHNPEFGDTLSTCTSVRMPEKRIYYFRFIVVRHLLPLHSKINTVLKPQFSLEHKWIEVGRKAHQLELF